jgi:glycosyltransferase involved in cell wall biosynthesis
VNDYIKEEYRPQIKVSVIIPAYNVEKCLVKCLDSVLKQTLKEIEIIVVDDGSTDTTPVILNKYKNEYSNIVILSQKNSKQGAARNRGLDIAKGEYIYFLDADDYIELNALEYLYAYAKDKQAEIVTFKTMSFCDDHVCEGGRSYKRTLVKDRKYTGKEYLDFCIKNQEFYPTVWLYFFRYDWIKKRRFIENIVYEDTPFCFCSFQDASNIYFTDQSFHYHRLHSGSTMTTGSSNFKLRSNIIGLQYMAEHMDKSDTNQVDFIKYIASTHYMHLQKIDNCTQETKKICSEFHAVVKKYDLISKTMLKEMIKLFIKKPRRVLL